MAVDLLRYCLTFKARRSVKALIALYFFDRLRWLLEILLSPAFYFSERLIYK